MAPTQSLAQTQSNMPTSNIHGDNSGFEEVASSTRLRTSTISIALPSSILANAQSPELRMYLAGQVARAAAIYCIDEIVIFSEHESNYNSHRYYKQQQQSSNNNFINPSEMTKFFATVLQYLETPQYLRKHLFPMSNDLRLVGLLNPLALPTHHSRSDHPRYREGVFLPTRQQKQKQKQHQSPPSKYVDVGLERPVEVDKQYSPGTRATIDLSLSGAGPTYSQAPGKYLFGRVLSLFASPTNVSSSLTGMYTGYKVRTAPSLSGVFSGSAIASSGYDLTIGTSERGTHISKSGKPSRSFALPEFSNLLIVFGGVHGLESSVIGDETLEELGIIVHPQHDENQDDAHNNDYAGRNINGSADMKADSDVGSNVGDLFDFYLNTCPQQGSRTIRTEEAILLSLGALQPFLNAAENN